MTTDSMARVRVSSSRLHHAEPDPDPEVESLRGLVHATEPSLNLLQIARSELRRFDIWVHNREVVVVPFREDRDSEVVCVRGTGASLTLLVGELLAMPGPVASSTLAEQSFSDIGELISAVVGGTAGVEHASVLHARSNNCDLVRITGPGAWWGEALTDDRLVLTDDGDASYWGRVLAIISALGDA